ncbi:MAG: CRISPR-associated helicase Cas3', partial [Thermoproteus sp.]
EVIKEMVATWCRARGTGPCRVDESVLDRQVAIAKRIEESEGLVVVRAPTGVGKTELWAAPFFVQWRVGEWFAPRMYVVEPMHALLNQMRERMAAYAKALAPGVTVGEDHGEAPSDVYLYTAVVTLTTVDALVYGYLAQRVLKWRQRGVETGYYTMPSGLLASAYIVFDEAHLMQDEFYLGPRVLGSVVCDLVEAGAKVVLSTATLPDAYLKYFKCVNPASRGKEIAEGVTELDLGGGVLLDLEGPDRKVDIELVEEPLTADALSRQLDCKSRSIVIVNTVRKAREIYKRLECERKAVVHSLMRKEDRDAASKRVEDGGVLVGTQALEVGLDLDLDALYTELSPVDSLVQRLGRVGRRGRGRALVFKAEGSAPYLKELVERTEREVAQDPSALNIWARVKDLVNKVYDAKLVEEIAEKGERIYVEALAYLSELSLFSYPPRREVLLRPSNYAIIYIVRGAPRVKVGRDELLRGLVKFSYRSYDESRLKLFIDNFGGTIYKIKELGDEHVVLEKVKKDSLVIEAGRRRDGEREKRLRDDEFVVFTEELGDLYDDAGIAVERLEGRGGSIEASGSGAAKARKRRSRKGSGGP